MSGPTSTTAEIEAFVAEITALLKGPLSNVDRALLVADRKDARAELARRNEAAPANGKG